MSIAERAVTIFLGKKYNCCQAVICAYCEEYGIDDTQIFKMTEGFGLGMGGLKDTCGAVTGMFMAIGLRNSAGDKTEPTKTKFDTYQDIRDAAADFRKKNGSIYCCELKAVIDGKQVVSCEQCVRTAAEYVDRYIKEH